MAEPVTLSITAGLPYSRRMRVSGAKSVWPTADAYEVRSQIRVGKDVSSALVAELTPFLSASYDGTDIVVELELTGAETRTLGPGNYDIIISDKGAVDANGLTILSGKVKIKSTITAATDD
jgi:hypothetical protein